VYFKVGNWRSADLKPSANTSAKPIRCKGFGSEEAVPHHVITMGIGTIMEARQNLLLAFGEKKAAAVAEAAEGPVTAMNPASALQFHANVKFFLDGGAATKLKKADYYRWVYENKPAWQQF
jgi:glucosamine-6-phosphate deaminase